MKAGWQAKTLGETCQIARGGSPRPIQEFITDDPNGVNWVKISDATASGKFIYETKEKIKPSGVSRSRLVKPGDFLLSNSMSFGRPYIMQTTGCIHDGWLVLSGYEQCFDQSFLYHLLGSPVVFEQFDRLAAGSTVRNLNIDLASRVSLPVPPLSEQHRIVAILDEAFDGIATAKANAEKNLQNARALFESHLQSVFTQRGEGWIERSIGDICTLKSGTSVGVSLEKAKGEIPYVKVSDMTYAGNETEIVSSSRFLDMADVGKNAVFPAGTTIFPKRGGAILTNKKRLTALPICADLNIMGVIPSGNLHPRLLYYYFLNVDMRLIGSGSSIPQINNYDIAPLKISFPETQDEQEAILQILDNLSAETQRLESLYQRKLAALDALKQSLLHQAFSGAL